MAVILQANWAPAELTRLMKSHLQDENLALISESPNLRDSMPCPH